MASIRVEKGTWKVKDSEGNITKLYPAGKEIDSVSGSQLVIEDSRAGALRINKTFGKSEQRKTTGAQLFDASKFETTTSAGATVTTNGDGSFTISGSGTLSQDFSMFHLYSHEETLKILKAGTLIMKNEVKTRPYCYVAILGSDGNILHEINNENSTSLHVDITGELLLTDNLTMRIGFYGGTGKDIVTGTIKPMLYFDGDSDGTWEPYTGNMPAPNPQYPQEIVSMGDSGSIETKVIGNNILSLEDRITNDRGLTQTIANGICTVSGTATSNAGFNLTLAGAYARTDVILTLPAGTYTATDCVLATYDGVNRKTYTNTFTVTEPLDITWVATRTYRVEEVVSETTYPMINVGDSAMTWEAYNEQILSINTPNGLPGIEVTDASLANYIDADGKMWVCDTREWDRGVDVQRVGVEVFDGSDDELWGAENTKTSGIYRVRSLMMAEYAKGYNTYETADILCDSYIAVPAGSTGTYECVSGISISTSGLAYVYDEKFNTADISLWTTHLAENPITVQYILATPIETPIPEEEMAAWRAMHSNEPTTTILSDADVEVEYPTSRVGAVALDADMRSREVEKKSGVIFIGDYTTETAVDFDNLIESGNYDFNAAYITSSLHKPIAEAGTLTVKHGDRTGYVTHIYQSRYGNVFVRFYNNSAWADWERMAKSSDLQKCVILDEGYDLNNLTRVGFYSCDAPVNGVASTWHSIIVMSINNDTRYIMQIAHIIGYDSLYIRRGHSDDGWTSWSRIITAADFTDNGETLVLNWL